MDNYPGFPDGIDGFAIGTNMQKQAERFGLEIKRTGVDSVELEGEIKRLHCGREVIEAKAVIIATGAHPKKLRLDREEKLTGAGVSYCATCDGAFFHASLRRCMSFTGEISSGLPKHCSGRCLLPTI
mgnify:CR=1 FL=1